MKNNVNSADVVIVGTGVVGVAIGRPHLFGPEKPYDGIATASWVVL